MKNKMILPLLAGLAFLALLSGACAAPEGPTPVALLTPVSNVLLPLATAETFSDPFAYCAAAGQIDAPDARYTGPMMSDELFKDYLRSAGLDPSLDYPPNFKEMTIWRCMDGKVYACNFGANIPCNSKANTDKTPTQAMLDYCKESPDSEFIPMSVTGHSVIYSWHCVKDVPEILNQIDTVDAAGYQSSFWQAVQPGPASSGSPQPAATSTPTGGGSGQIVFYSDRDGGYDNIYLLHPGGTDVIRLTHSQSNSFPGPFSPKGTQLLFTGFGLIHSYIGVMNADGNDPVNITGQSDWDESFPAWSPDSTRIVFTSRRDGNNEIYVMDANGDHATRLTDNAADDFAPAWGPFGTQIAFLSDRDNQAGVYSIYIMNTDGSEVKRLTDDKGNDYTPAWSPDGGQILFRSVQDGQSDIFRVNTDGSGMVNLTNNPAEDWAPSWSSDGRLIAFQSDRDGNWEIYVMDADGSNPINLTRNAADDQRPYWKP